MGIRWGCGRGGDKVGWGQGGVGKVGTSGGGGNKGKWERWGQGGVGEVEWGSGGGGDKVEWGRWRRWVTRWSGMGLEKCADVTH